VVGGKRLAFCFPLPFCDLHPSSFTCPDRARRFPPLTSPKLSSCPISSRDLTTDSVSLCLHPIVSPHAKASDPGSAAICSINILSVLPSHRSTIPFRGFRPLLSPPRATPSLTLRYVDDPFPIFQTCIRPSIVPMHSSFLSALLGLIIMFVSLICILSSYALSVLSTPDYLPSSLTEPLGSVVCRLQVRTHSFFFPIVEFLSQ